MRFGGDKAKADAVYKGVEPLTPDDIAEVVVFTAGRRENVVVADTLIFPNHQVCFDSAGRHSHSMACTHVLLLIIAMSSWDNSGCCNGPAPQIVKTPLLYLANSALLVSSSRSFSRLSVFYALQ